MDQREVRESGHDEPATTILPLASMATAVAVASPIGVTTLPSTPNVGSRSPSAAAWTEFGRFSASSKVHRQLRQAAASIGVSGDGRGVLRIV